MNIEKLQMQHQDMFSRAERLRDMVVFQLLELFNNNNITLGVPIESRIKSWPSVSEKIDRKNTQLESILDLQDFIGIRSILLFKRDLAQVKTLISKTFEVISAEDTGDRLGDSEFGYQSQHYIVKIPRTWLELPSLSGLNEFFIELQVRTLAQHIWAAASHKLQYKQKEGVPPRVLRAINRVSALLETVDLEFERVLDERDNYVQSTQKKSITSERLNVDSLASILSAMLPPENKIENEPYADVLDDMHILGPSETSDLIVFIEKHLSEALGKNAAMANNPKVIAGSIHGSNYDRIKNGVYYSHAGLMSEMLRQEHGDFQLNDLHCKRIDKALGLGIYMSQPK